jgi:hypothetical protein
MNKEQEDQPEGVVGMTIQSIKQHKQWLVPAAIVLALAGVFVPRTACARISVNTIDPVGIVAHNGRHVTLAGPLAITAGERASLRVTVTQRTTGAVAEGHLLLTGTGTTNQWEITAAVEGRETFEAGPATATAIARTTAGGQPPGPQRPRGGHRGKHRSRPEQLPHRPRLPWQVKATLAPPLLFLVRSRLSATIFLPDHLGLPATYNFS